MPRVANEEPWGEAGTGLGDAGAGAGEGESTGVGVGAVGDGNTGGDAGDARKGDSTGLDLATAVR